MDDDDDELLSQPVFLDAVVVVDGKISGRDYLAKLEEKTEKEFQEFLGHSAAESAPMVYMSCPICDRQKRTKVEHIKTCAKQNGIGPKDVLLLLKDVAQQVDTTTKKVSKPKMIKTISTTVTTTTNTLSSSQVCDEEQKAKVIESRLSMFGFIDNKFNLQPNNIDQKPDIWTAANLDRNIEEYILNSFKEYF